jgi:sugar/nucleoside kinase (ribokinase family)
VAIAGATGVNAIDPTGAGDSFAAALCVGLREQMSMDRLVNFCNCTGSLVCTKKGAIGMALPTRQEVEDMMASGICTVTMTTLEELE